MKAHLFLAMWMGYRLYEQGGSHAAPATRLGSTPTLAKRGHQSNCTRPRRRADEAAAPQQQAVEEDPTTGPGEDGTHAPPPPTLPLWPKPSIHLVKGREQHWRRCSRQSTKDEAAATKARSRSKQPATATVLPRATRLATDTHKQFWTTTTHKPGRTPQAQQTRGSAARYPRTPRAVPVQTPRSNSTPLKLLSLRPYPHHKHVNHTSHPQARPHHRESIHRLRWTQAT